MNMTIEFITPSVNLNTKNETTVIGPSTSDDLHVIQLQRHKINTGKQKDKKDNSTDNSRKDKLKKKRKKKKQLKKKLKERGKTTEDVPNTTPNDKQLLTPDISTTTPISVDLDISSTTQGSVDMNNKLIPDPADVIKRGTMINNQGVKIVSPEFIRKLQESLQAKIDRIRQIGQLPGFNTTTAPTKPFEATVNAVTSVTLKPQANVTATTQNIVSTTKVQKTIFSKTTESTTPTTVQGIVGTIPAVQSSTGKISTTVSNLETTISDNNGITGNTLLSNIDKTTQSNNKNEASKPTDQHNIKTPPELDKSGLVIIKERENDNSTSTETEVKDIDIIIFPSSRSDFKKRKKERKKYCRKINFGTAAKGFQCCKKTLNCFDELPHKLDETVFHHGNSHYNEAERLHLCHDVDESFECLGEVLGKQSCKQVAHIMDEKLKPQLDAVKLFYYNNCNRATSLSPSPGPNPTSSSFPANTSLPETTDKGTEGYHTHTSSFAPYLGGAIMGVFGLVVIIIFAIYCRNRVTKRKRTKQKREDQSRASAESSRYVCYNRRKSDVYAEIDEKSMITTVSFVIDGNSNDGSCGSRRVSSAPSLNKVDVDNHGYLSPRGSLPEDDIKADIPTTDLNLFTHGYIELKSESGESAQSYAKLEIEPEDDYIQADKIESSPDRTSKKSDEQGHMYFILEKDKEQNKNIDTDSKDN